MSEYMFGIIYDRPSKKDADRMDKICRKAGGYGFNEVNRREGDCPGINNGHYQGWFCGPNLGSPFDDRLRVDVLSQCEGILKKYRDEDD